MIGLGLAYWLIGDTITDLECIGIGVFGTATIMAWTKRVPEFVLWMTLALGNAVGSSSAAINGEYISMLFTGLVSVGCIWIACRCRHELTEHQLQELVDEKDGAS